MSQSVLATVPQVLLLGYLIWLRGPGARVRSVWREFGIAIPRLSDLAWALLLVAGVFLLLGCLAAVQTFLPEPARRLLQGGFRWRLSDPRLLPLAALFSLCTGYREELFFRSYLLTRLGQVGVPPAAGVAVSGLLFAFGHAYQGVAGLAVALLIGIYFAAAFQRLCNLNRLAWAHGLYNFAVLLTTLFADALPWRLGFSSWPG
jgi:membrane protease YdiL (CAAX protease family)